MECGLIKLLPDLYSIFGFYFNLLAGSCIANQNVILFVPPSQTMAMDNSKPISNVIFFSSPIISKEKINKCRILYILLHVHVHGMIISGELLADNMSKITPDGHKCPS